MNDVKAAAACLLDGAVLVCESSLCSDAAFFLAYRAVKRHIELPALCPFISGLLGNEAGIHAPGFQEVRLELVEPLGNLFELRVLLFKLCLPVLHPCGAVLPIIGKDAHTFRKALRPVLHGQVFTEQFVLLLVVQVKPVEGSLQTGTNILSVGVREVAGDDLSRNGVTVRRVCGKLIGVGSGSLVELPDSVIAVHPRLIEDVGLCLDLLSPCAGIRCPILPQADRACGGICIQGIVGVYIVRQLFQQGGVLRREAVQEVLCELRVINRCGLPVLKELADVLCIAFAKILPGLIGCLHLVGEAVYQLFSHGIGQPVSENAPPDIQGVAQLMGDRGKVVCDSGADAVVAPVILAANSGASDMALGDVQSEVVPDLLHGAFPGSPTLAACHRSGWGAASVETS